MHSVTYPRMRISAKTALPLRFPTTISAGVLTPAISVVSAIEGIQFQTGISTGTVVGISIGILVRQPAAAIHDSEC